jgi:hypothetical protein
MDRSSFILFGLFGCGIGLAALLLLGPQRRAGISPFAWWFCMIVGSTVGLFGLSHSTAPSFAPLVTASGKASAFTDQKFGRNSKFVFAFFPEGGNPINIETHIIVPHWGNAEVFSGRTLKVIYLSDRARSVSNEAVDIEILSGDDAGWHHSLDARPFGIWLAIPVGATIAGFGYIGFRYRKSDLKATEPSEFAIPISGP